MGQLGKSSPTTPPKAAPKVLGLSVSSTVEAPTLEVEDPALDVEEMEFASQFAPPCGTERQYLDVEPGQPASPATGRGEESEGDRTLKAAKSAARRLLEDLVEEQERLDALEPPAASHMPFSVLEGARLGFLDSTTGSGVHPTGQCGEEHGNGEAVGSSNGAASSGTCPSSRVLTSTTSRPNSDATRSFSAVPAYVDYAVPSSNGGGAPDTDGAKAGPHDGQLDRSGYASPHRGTKAGSHGGTEDVFYYGANGGSYNSTAAFANGGSYNSTAAFANGGSYNSTAAFADGGSYDSTAAFFNDGTATLFDDGNATFFDDGTATFSKDGAVACHSNVAKAFDIDEPQRHHTRRRTRTS